MPEKAADPETPPLMLSVSGARGIAGRTMTDDVARDFAGAFGSFLRTRTGADRPRLCVGRDTRPSGPGLMKAAIDGLVSAGCDVVDLGVVATPTVGVMIGEHGAHGGMVVTASHNPAPWNGLKCLDHHGVAPSADHASEIIRAFRQRAIDRSAERGSVTRDATANECHLAKLLAAVDPEPVRTRSFKVVLDSVNGAGAAAGRNLLERFGCTLIHLNGEPHGRFAHPPEPVRENLTDLRAAVREHGAACGFAQDPDADRLAIVDEQGTYIGEEYTLVLAARFLLDRHGGGALAANLSTSRMIDDLAARYDGAHVIRTPVGEAHVAAAMRAHDALVGGEGNGGVIYPVVTWVRDSLSAMALVLSLLAVERKPLSEFAAGLPRYVMVKRKYDLGALGGHEAVGTLLRRTEDAFAGERVDTADGVRIDFADGWVHLRPSNTEPIVRLIAEARTEAEVERLIHTTAEAAGLA